MSAAVKLTAAQKRMREAETAARRSPLLARVCDGPTVGSMLFSQREIAEAVSLYEFGLLGHDGDNRWTITNAGRDALVEAQS